MCYFQQFPVNNMHLAWANLNGQMKEAAPYFCFLKSESTTQTSLLSPCMAASQPPFWILNLSHFFPVESTESSLVFQLQKKTQVQVKIASFLTKCWSPDYEMLEGGTLNSSTMFQLFSPCVSEIHTNLLSFSSLRIYKVKTWILKWARMRGTTAVHVLWNTSKTGWIVDGWMVGWMGGWTVIQRSDSNVQSGWWVCVAHFTTLSMSL